MLPLPPHHPCRRKIFIIASLYPPSRFLFSPLCRNFSKFSGKGTMSRKRTRASKTTPENPILIDEEVKERFDSIFKHQPMMPKKWERFCDARSLLDDELVQEFYASLTIQDATKFIVRKKKVPLTSKFINNLFNLPDIEEDKYYPMMNNINWDFLQQVLDVVTNLRSQWIIRKYGSHSCQREYLKQVEKADFKTQANLKGQYVQGCITNHDLERLIEKVHELNQGKQEEPTEQNTEESTNEAETEANSVRNTEEEESDKEPNSPKLVEGSIIPEPEVELEKETVKLSVELESTTPMPTSASALKKSKLSITMDMCKCYL
ncbi:hypothetical protein PVK06_026934 [Gossypium arboreum]|uniref:Uncharacterized protein n=1 Tax=Gossypium arboreum TaxID=29729 RepID=A0ABR0P2F8_GOSAR|nr:hypothetical protein PVK06_026934 [Gossypium arboreum]